VVQALGELKLDGVIHEAEPIAKTSEKFLSLTINGNIKFLDSLCFTLCSLSKMVETMARESTDAFKITREEFASEVANGADIGLLFKKGVYPYSLMKTLSDFNRDTLPDQDAFYSDLTESHIDDSEYKHAKKVWESFNVQNMGHYHDIYVRSDVASLADCMENMRSIMMESYGLELCHYYSIPMVTFVFLYLDFQSHLLTSNFYSYRWHTMLY
jgi:hypothetical protein